MQLKAFKNLENGVYKLLAASCPTSETYHPIVSLQNRLWE